VALLNNLGGVTPLEMAVLAEELVRSSHRRPHPLDGGPRAPDDLARHEGLLGLAPARDEGGRTRASGPRGALGLARLPARGRDRHRGTARRAGADPAHPLGHDATRRLIVACCDALVAAEAELNALDAKSGDGDTGSTLATAARALARALDRLPLADHTQLYRALGVELSQTMGGSSGVLLAIFFAAAGDASAGGANAIEALKAGLDRIQQVGGARAGDRTMIDALDPALRALPEGLAAAAAAARAGADATAGFRRARAGRASYLAEGTMLGYNDPGAEAVASVLEHLVQEGAEGAGA
jgi:dihydroxyacetone kinase